MSSEKLQPAFNEGIQVCCISLNRNDRIRLIGLPVDVINAIRTAITSSWGPLQNEEDYHGAYEFKLKGYPWCGQSDDAVYCRRLLAAVLKTMAQFGWNLLQAADVSKKPNDKDTMFFEKGIPDPDAELFAMSFNMNDRIRIIDAPTFTGCVEDALQSQWPNGIQHKEDYYGSIEYKLSGNPWWADGSETVYCRMLLCQIIANVRSKGYKLYGSIDITVGVEGADLETWIFRRVGEAWQ
ncbi:hypothetical protein HA402_011639 [Bradysia odoriphaga]|nr:hypothetical protein HA402_011639 [Bradysia odoriphaga]